MPGCGRRCEAGTRDAAVVIVAQRVSTIMHADQIIVLDEGRIAGIGTHQELLAGCDSVPGDRHVPARRGGRGMMGRPGGGMARGAGDGTAGRRAPAERSKDFRGTLRRLLARLRPERVRLVDRGGAGRRLGRVHW